MPADRPLASSSTAARVTPRGTTRGTSRAAAARSASERRLVTVLVSTVAGAMVLLSGVAVRSTMIDRESQAQIGTTFGQAALRQEEFRSRNERFANWTELSEDGMRLPRELRVVASNASRSHWYLRVRHRETGVTCARVGQLLENPNRGPLSCD
jgi:hypothetical protein